MELPTDAFKIINYPFKIRPVCKVDFVFLIEFLELFNAFRNHFVRRGEDTRVVAIDVSSHRPTLPSMCPHIDSRRRRQIRDSSAS